MEGGIGIKEAGDRSGWINFLKGMDLPFVWPRRRSHDNHNVEETTG